MVLLCNTFKELKFMFVSIRLFYEFDFSNVNKK